MEEGRGEEGTKEGCLEGFRELPGRGLEVMGCEVGLNLRFLSG